MLMHDSSDSDEVGKWWEFILNLDLFAVGDLWILVLARGQQERDAAQQSKDKTAHLSTIQPEGYWVQPDRKATQ